MNPENDHFGYQGPGPIDHMQHDPQNNLYYHNQFYPEAGRDQQRDRQNHYGQQQRNRYHQLHPHFQHLENGQQHHLGNQQQIHQEDQMNHHHRQQQNQFHQERQRFQEVQHHVVNLHRNQEQRHQNQQPDREAQDQHHRMHMPQNNQMNLQHRRNGSVPTHHHHTNRYNPILNDQNRRGRPMTYEQNRREQDLGAMNQRPHLQNSDPFDNGRIHFQGNPGMEHFNQEVQNVNGPFHGNPPIHSNGPAVAQMQQSPVPVPQDPIAKPQPLDPEIIRLREENRRLTDRVAALYDLHPISQEDLALLQKELEELRAAKARLETENSEQRQELERLTDLSFRTGQENTAMKPKIVYLEMRVKALEGELANSRCQPQQSSSSTAPIPASGIKKEVVEDHPADIRPSHEVKVVAMVKSNTKTIKREVMEMPKTAEEAVERYKSMFEGKKKIISERFNIQCFLFNKTNPGEEKDDKWVPRKVLKACQLRNFYQHFRPKREYPEWKEVKKNAKAEERWRKRWMAVREEQMAQYHAGLIFFNDDYKNLKL
ncbi:unnamed protein product [Caenorhabditis nigoni]